MSEDKLKELETKREEIQQKMKNHPEQFDELNKELREVNDQYFLEAYGQR